MKRMMAVLLLLSFFCAITAMGEETVPSCEARYAVLNGDDTLKIEASLVTCSPLDHYVAIAVRCAYRSPVNFEVTAFHVYFNDQPVETTYLRFQDLKAGGVMKAEMSSTPTNAVYTDDQLPFSLSK